MARQAVPWLLVFTCACRTHGSSGYDSVPGDAPVAPPPSGLAQTTTPTPSGLADATTPPPGSSSRDASGVGAMLPTPQRARVLGRDATGRLLLSIDATDWMRGGRARAYTYFAVLDADHRCVVETHRVDALRDAPVPSDPELTANHLAYGAAVTEVERFTQLIGSFGVRNVSLGAGHLGIASGRLGVLAFVDGEDELFIRRGGGKRFEHVPAVDAGLPIASPEGGYIAYGQCAHPCRATSPMAVAVLETETERSVSYSSPYPAGGVRALFWSQDGKRTLYATFDDAPSDPKAARICIARLERSEKAFKPIACLAGTLTARGGDPVHVLVSPSATYVAFEMTLGNSHRLAVSVVELASGRIAYQLPGAGARVLDDRGRLLVESAMTISPGLDSVPRGPSSVTPLPRATELRSGPGAADDRWPNTTPVGFVGDAVLLGPGTVSDPLFGSWPRANLNLTNLKDRSCEWFHPEATSSHDDGGAP